MPFKAGEVAVDIHGNVIPLKRDLIVAQKAVTKSAVKMESSFKKSFAGVRKAAKVGVASIALVGVAAAALAIPIIRTGAQFEQSMATVRGVMRATKKEFIDLTKVAKRMGETTEFTASEAAEGLKFMGMAGFTAAQAIQALPGVLDLATAGQIELNEASDIATNALTAMRLSVGDLGRVNDVFVATVNRSNTNIRMMAESFKYAAPVASAFGYDVEQLSALIGALGNAGVQGSMAGTQLAFAFTKSARAAKELGLGPGADFIDVLRGIKAEGWTAQKVLKIFSVRAGRAALILKESIPTYEKLLKATRAARGEAKALADIMRSTVIGRWKELKSVVESVAIDAFTERSSELGREIQNVTRFVRENKASLVGLASTTIWVAKQFLKLANVLRRMTSGADEFQRQIDVGLISPEQLLKIHHEGGDILKIIDANTKAIASGKKAWEHEMRKRPELVLPPVTKLTTALELSIEGKDIPEQMRERIEIERKRMAQEKLTIEVPVIFDLKSDLTIKRLLEASRGGESKVLEDMLKTRVARFRELAIMQAPKPVVTPISEEELLGAKGGRPTEGSTAAQAKAIVDAARGRTEQVMLTAEAQRNLLEGLQKEAKALDINIEKYKSIEELSARIIKVSERNRKKAEKEQAKATIEWQGQVQASFRKHEDAIAGIRQEADEETLAAQTANLENIESHYGTLVNMFRTHEDELSGIRQVTDEGTLASQERYLEGVQEAADAVKEAEEKKRAKIEQTNMMIASTVTDGFMAMIEGSKSAAAAFADMAKSILADLARMIIKQMIFNALQKMSTSIFGMGGGGVTPGPVPAIEKMGLRPQQHGNAFTNTVANKPTIAPMALFGEAGPEAIMPLAKTSKGLGVVAAIPQNGGGAKEVHVHLENVNINAVDSESFYNLAVRNPEAIIEPVKMTLIAGDEDLRALLRE